VKRLVYLSIAVFFVALILIVTGCATAQPTGRKGLLESGGDPGVSARSRSASSVRNSGRTVASMPLASSGKGLAPGSAPLHRPAIEIASGSLRWPLQQVRVTSPFGQRGKEFHEGIDLKAQQGTPVLAAQEGTVIYAGSKIRGYGKMIVIRHLRQFSTIYAHCSQLLVRTGQYVRQGQKISITGKTGHVTGPHLHFEVRDGLAALNPLDLLPSLHAASTPAPPPTAPVMPSQQRVASIRPQPPKQRVAAAKAATPVSFDGDTD
jgi:murein DD-endopeptidase MepM/ murein hydrolase activator NlpD